MHAILKREACVGRPARRHRQHEGLRTHRVLGVDVPDLPVKYPASNANTRSKELSL